MLKIRNKVVVMLDQSSLLIRRYLHLQTTALHIFFVIIVEIVEMIISLAQVDCSDGSN